jgi:hypothetical protein
VRVGAWFGIAAAFSSVPPFSKKAVKPVARKLWLPRLGGGADSGRGGDESAVAEHTGMSDQTLAYSEEDSLMKMLHPEVRVNLLGHPSIPVINPTPARHRSRNSVLRHSTPRPAPRVKLTRMM